MMLIDNKFNIGDFVYLITDIDQDRRLITGLRISTNSVLYQISIGSLTSEHYDFEITKERQFLEDLMNNN